MLLASRSWAVDRARLGLLQPANRKENKGEIRVALAGFLREARDNFSGPIPKQKKQRPEGDCQINSGECVVLGRELYGGQGVCS